MCPAVSDTGSLITLVESLGKIPSFLLNLRSVAEKSPNREIQISLIPSRDAIKYAFDDCLLSTLLISALRHRKGAKADTVAPGLGRARLLEPHRGIVDDEAAQVQVRPLTVLDGVVYQWTRIL